MRKIAVTQRLVENESYFEIREALDINYCKLLKACGFLPIVLPYEIEFEQYFNEFNIDGVLFTGGNDLYSVHTNELSRKRDQFEQKLLEYCIEREIPIFGFCRGMQLIAEYFGSSLKRVDGEVNQRASLVVNQESKYANYLHKLVSVNSYHNFCIDKVSEELIVSAVNDKGIIKAIEHKRYKIFCVMWHSEREEELNVDEIRLIRDFFNFGLEEIIEIAKKASEAIIEIYKQDFSIEYKLDNSPVTQADLVSNQIILDGLQAISTYPVLSEESPIDYEVRRNWNRFWSVDPLDGTKDFIAQNGEFTINIALIDKKKPILGVVYIPSTGDVYYAIENGGAFKNTQKIFNSSQRIDLIASDSNFHSTEEIKAFLKKYKINHVQAYGSSIKICKLAEGEIDVYPRLNGTKEWDTAASHIIANEAGCKLVDLETKKELTYNKKNINNNYFIACRNDLEFKI
jgi:3'(2'),5'-bisphosphate nucleotidase